MLWLKFEFVKICCFAFFILWIYFLSEVEGKHMVKRGIMDNINNGIKYAGQMMGINNAADVANLVAKAFAPKTTTKKFDPSSLFQYPEKVSFPERDDGASSTINPSDMLGGILRFIGFDAGKLGALAINALLMIAQLIGNTLTKRQNFPKSAEDGRLFDESEHENEESTYEDQPDQRSSRDYFDDGMPLDWILTNPPEGLLQYVEQIVDRKLPEKLTQVVEQLENKNGQGDCIKLLMCKSAPFIWGMQESISNRLNQSDKLVKENVEYKNPMSFLFKNLPNIEEYRRHGHLCEKRYSNFCNRNGA